ncbi:serine/threonine-protein kinase [Streptomyces sp. NPDC050704]|uniref:serine/threonine-protein kinase n=1 Tax=Streptomyces sp. NPDC050704 TaxID=3157219 RepID=UPI003446A588
MSDSQNGAAVSSGENQKPAEHEQPDGIGRLLAGRYRVVAQLGRGGMGVVWRALDEVLGREVAVKELRTYTDAAGPELADLGLRMQREARAAARVRHPGVVAVHDVAEIDGRPLIVMELVDGPSLDDVLRERGTLDAREAAAIGAKVMDALAAAHRAGVLHRDVKPGNILLDRSGRIVLTDFGIATMDDPGDGSATHLTRSGELVGSLDYLAPERAQGHDPGPASDVWALGATLYAAVEGTSPFRRTSTWSTLTAIVSEPLPEPRSGGPLGPVLQQLMHKQPEARPDADRARELLEAVAAGSDLDSATTGLRGPAPRPREMTEQSVPVVPPGFGPPESGGAGAGVQAAGEAGLGIPGTGTPGTDGSGMGTPGMGTPGTDGAGVGGAGTGGPGTPPAGLAASPPSPGPGFGPPEPVNRASAAPTVPPRRRGRALLAAAAVTVVLAATGVTVALMNGSDDPETGARPSTSKGAESSPSESASRGSVDLSDDARPTEQGDQEPSAPGKTPESTEDAKPTREAPAPAPSPEPTDDGATNGTSGGTTGGGGGGGSSPAPACDPIGGGKYNCVVWKTATSYTADGAEAGTLNAGTNYFYCQQNLARRETYDKWTNVWWAKTDDDSGNTNVFVSDVYLKGGDNDAPVPGLPVC